MDSPGAPQQSAKAPPSHRPWPLPSGRPWVVAMRWETLLFAHWPVPPGRLRPLIPEGLELETREGSAWLGVVPFAMAGVRPRFLPPAPWLSAFPELNVRTYVTAGGKPGVWFFSLDAASRLAVRAARAGFHLPYFDARMKIERESEGFAYESVRTHRGASPAAFRARFAPRGADYRARPGDLDHWLTERYCLYAADRSGRLWRGEIDHAPWTLRAAQAEIEVNTLGAPIGCELNDPPAALHYAERIEVKAWLNERVP